MLTYFLVIANKNVNIVPRYTALPHCFWHIICSSQWKKNSVQTIHTTILVPIRINNTKMFCQWLNEDHFSKVLGSLLNIAACGKRFSFGLDRNIANPCGLALILHLKINVAQYLIDKLSVLVLLVTAYVLFILGKLIRNQLNSTKRLPCNKRSETDGLKHKDQYIQDNLRSPPVAPRFGFEEHSSGFNIVKKNSTWSKIIEQLVSEDR